MNLAKVLPHRACGLSTAKLADPSNAQRGAMPSISSHSMLRCACCLHTAMVTVPMGRKWFHVDRGGSESTHCLVVNQSNTVNQQDFRLRRNRHYIGFSVSSWQDVVRACWWHVALGIVFSLASLMYSCETTLYLGSHACCLQVLKFLRYIPRTICIYIYIIITLLYNIIGYIANICPTLTLTKYWSVMLLCHLCMSPEQLGKWDGFYTSPATLQTSSASFLLHYLPVSSNMAEKNHQFANGPMIFAN